jgi:hypothetical protein
LFLDKFSTITSNNGVISSGISPVNLLLAKLIILDNLVRILPFMAIPHHQASGSMNCATIHAML